MSELARSQKRKQEGRLKTKVERRDGIKEGKKEGKGKSKKKHRICIGIPPRSYFSEVLDASSSSTCRLHTIFTSIITDAMSQNIATQT